MFLQVAVEFVDLSSPIESLAVAAKAAAGKHLPSAHFKFDAKWNEFCRLNLDDPNREEQHKVKVKEFEAHSEKLVKAAHQVSLAYSGSDAKHISEINNAANKVQTPVIWKKIFEAYFGT